MKDKAKRTENNPIIADDVCKCDNISSSNKLHAAITLSQLSDLNGYSIQQIEQKFSEIYNLSNYEVNLKEGCVLDCYVSAYWFSLEECMTLKSKFILMNLIHELLTCCENGINLEENTAILKEYFPRNTDDDVTSIEFKKIIVYISETLFQHYKLYKFMFENKQPQITNKIQVLIESIPNTFAEQPPPLEEGLEERLYFKYIQPNSSPDNNPVNEENIPESEEKFEADVAATIEDQLCDDCQTNVMMEESSIEQLSVNNELVRLLKNMTADDIKLLVTSIAEKKLSPLKVELNNKMKDRETVLLSKMKKLQKN